MCSANKVEGFLSAILKLFFFVIFVSIFKLSFNLANVDPAVLTVCSLIIYCIFSLVYDKFIQELAWDWAVLSGTVALQVCVC